MREVPAGRVELSDRRTRRAWTVDVAPFLMGSHPVTQGERLALLDGAVSPTPRLPAASVSWWEAIDHANSRSVSEGLQPAYLVHGEQVSWDQPATGYRLPTEAEWEHACRAATSGPRYGALDDIAWYRHNSDDQLREVGLKQPNGWGLHDLIGNVWEWCWDLYDPQVYGTYRVLRGGGWFDEHWSCRASVRRRSHPTLRIDDVGFRLVRSLG